MFASLECRLLLDESLQVFEVLADDIAHYAGHGPPHVGQRSGWKPMALEDELDLNTGLAGPNVNTASIRAPAYPFLVDAPVLLKIHGSIDRTRDAGDSFIITEDPVTADGPDS